jgi:hypothetical protein
MSSYAARKTTSSFMLCYTKLFIVMFIFDVFGGESV